MIPRNVCGIFPGVAAEANFYFSPRSRLGAKVIVAESRAAYRRIAWHGLCEPLGRSTAAQTTDLWAADPLFYCVMLFERKTICLEYLIHECVHAAAFYWQRNRRSAGVLEHARDDKSGEETIAYGASFLATRINTWLKLSRLIRSDDC